MAVKNRFIFSRDRRTCDDARIPSHGNGHPFTAIQCFRGLKIEARFYFSHPGKNAVDPKPPV